MCGIVGYIGNETAQDIILPGLHRLEYRGYDSAGIATVHEGKLAHRKSLGKLSMLDEKLDDSPISGSLGIGHTRWATHGMPSEVNAHPHFDTAEEIAVVHNGIIENFQDLRQELEDEGVTFRSATDTEVLAHLIRKYYDGDLFAAVKRALQDVRGAYAIGVIAQSEPGILVAARQGSPLIVGFGEQRAYIASDVPALLPYTRKVMYLEEGQVCALRRGEHIVEDRAGNPQSPAIVEVELDETASEKEGFPHFMLKEIHQQPTVVSHALLSYVDKYSGALEFPELGLEPDVLQSIRRIIIVACGTAWHAGMVGKYLIEEFAQIPTEVDLASEFRYGNRILDETTLVIPVTQSGETADTLEALRIARRKNAHVLGIVNVVGSSIAREANGVLYTHAGPEIGVASTKAYTSQLVALSLLAIHLGEIRGALNALAARALLEHLRTIPDKIAWCLQRQAAIQRCTDMPQYRDAQNAMFIGRGYNYPSALEGALKLKEISYIHVEGYASGEMKHGPIALITPELPVVAIATRGPVYEKVVSNIEEIKARGGILLAIATEGDRQIEKLCDHVFHIPDCFDPFSPMVVAAPLQLFAYYISVGLGRDVDQPRNLAKSVTVE